MWQRRRHSNISLSNNPFPSLFFLPVIQRYAISCSLVLSIFRSSWSNDVKRGWSQAEKETEREKERARERQRERERAEHVTQRYKLITLERGWPVVWSEPARLRSWIEKSWERDPRQQRARERANENKKDVRLPRRRKLRIKLGSRQLMSPRRETDLSGENEKETHRWIVQRVSDTLDSSVCVRSFIGSIADNVVEKIAPRLLARDERPIFTEHSLRFIVFDRF